MKIKFNEIAHFVAGQSPESKYYSPKEGVPFLQGNRTFGSMYPSIDTYTTKVTKIAKKGDVLMSVRAPVGDLNIAPCDLCIGRGLSAISSKDNDNMFVYYVLKYNIKNIVKNGSGTTYDSITKDIIDNIELIVPDNKKKWSNISKILFSIDEQIRRNDDMVQKLQVLAQSSFHYFFANCSSKKEPLSSFIIEHKKSVLQVNEVEDTKGMIPFFTSGDTIKYIDKNLIDGFNLFLSTGGNASVKSYYGKASYSTDTWCLTAKNDMQFYIFEYLKMIENQMDSLYFHGTGLKHLQKPLFLNSKIPVPTENLVKYNSIVEPIFRKISDIDRKTIQLNSLKNNLLPLLINGQLE